jgi:hypothetical protein
MPGPVAAGPGRRLAARPDGEVYANLLEDGYGGFAEYVSVPVKVLSLKPANLSFEEAPRYRWRGVTALQQSVGRAGGGSRKHWFLVSFALHRWRDSPRIVKTADYRPRWRAQVLCWAPDHLTRAPLLRTAETTSRIA